MGDYLPVKGYETVSVYRCGQAVKLELNRPARMNALDRQLRLDLLDAVRQVAADEDIRAVLLTGAGRAFSSGADLKDERALTPEGHPDIHNVLVEQYHPVIPGLRPGAGCRVRVLRAGVRQYRPGAGRRLLAAGAQPDRVRQGRRARDARRAARRGQGAGVGTDQPGLAGRRAGRPGRGPVFQAGRRPDRLLRGFQVAAEQMALRADGRPARVRGPDPAGKSGVG